MFSIEKIEVTGGGELREINNFFLFINSSTLLQSIKLSISTSISISISTSTSILIIKLYNLYILFNLLNSLSGKILSNPISLS